MRLELTRVGLQVELANHYTTGGLNKKQQEGFLTALVIAIKNNLTTPIRKHPNEFKVHVKTVWTKIKEDFSLDLNPLD